MSELSLSERQERTVELLREGLQAYEKGDVEAVLSLLDPEVEVYTSVGLVNVGTHRGHDEYLRWNDQWTEAWEALSVQPLSIEPVGERHAVAVVHQRARGRASGVEVEMKIAFMSEDRGGKAIRFHLYPTREEAIEAALRGEAEDGA